MRRFLVALLFLGLVHSAHASAASPMPKDFQPDPRSVQRYGPAYRYPQAGWIVLHIEGEPYERGVQHGRLMANEIARTIFAASPPRNARKTPSQVGSTRAR